MTSTLNVMVTGQVGQYDFMFGHISSPCAGGVTEQPCALVTVETVILSIECIYCFWLRMDDSLICAETVLRNGMAQAHEF